jgi:hypothetical protein
MVRTLLAAITFGFSCSSALAQTGEQTQVTPEDAITKMEKSPWLLMPTFQSNPKLGTSLGVMGGYIHYFDEKSRPSIFALMGQYTSTDSTIAGGFGKASFDEDRQRLLAGLMYGNVKNDYDDYLGTGVPLKSTGTLKSFISRYQYRVAGNWFVGVQGLIQNMAVTGETQFDQMFLDLVGVRPYKSGGAGLVAQYDSRDNENSPTRGWLANLNNIAYRESLGGDDDFDVIRADLRYFWAHGNGNVLAVRSLNHFTSNAPTQAKAPVQLRGYKIGQYNGEYMSHIEVEERYRLGAKFTATAFVGVACTYGDGKSCTDGENQYPAVGAGVQYILKPKEGIVLNLEYAQGKGGNYGVYLKMGYAY